MSPEGEHPRTAKSAGLNFLVSAWQGSVETPCGADWQLSIPYSKDFPSMRARQLADSTLTAP